MGAPAIAADAAAAGTIGGSIPIALELASVARRLSPNGRDPVSNSCLPTAMAP
jgi:hypothetical protein